MEAPSGLHYSPEHEWLKVENGIATLGITDYAQDSLGDVVFVELPPVGRTLAEGEAFGVVESVKAVSDVYSPIAGEIIEVNESLESSPEAINAAPYGTGWLLKLRVSGTPDTTKLMDAKAYGEFTAH